MAELSPNARRVIGFMFMEGVNAEGIFAPEETWEEIRKAFPPPRNEHGHIDHGLPFGYPDEDPTVPVYYDDEAGM